MKKNSFKNFIKTFAIVYAVSLAVMKVAAVVAKKRDMKDLDLQKDKLEGAGRPQGLAKAESGADISINMLGDNLYVTYVKRFLDVFLSSLGMVVLAPVFALISLAIIIDDPGPVLFTQKRVGKNKTFFKLHKFRSMKMCTPHDTPTHLLENPEQYITRVGKILRKYSLDELPQIWDIFVGNLSIVGPRPALWNQVDLVKERDKYLANDITPGLTGWAQINGRDELEIPKKASLDGEYCSQMMKGGFAAFKMDLKCFIGTFKSVATADGVVEGGTGAKNKGSKDATDKVAQGLFSFGKKKTGEENFTYRPYTTNASTDELIGHIGFEDCVYPDFNATRKVLITGANSYIGESFKNYATEKYPGNFVIETLDMQDENWREHDFSGYDIVYHVAGIAHADVGDVSEETKQKYYTVNTDLAFETARKAKAAGVKEFIFMSSMIVYGDSASLGSDRNITFTTVPKAANFYGDSKLQADVAVRRIADEDFKVIVLRPPMIYGKDSKGNYPTLAKIAKLTPVFPKVDNARSMLHIDNLCEFLCQVMLVENNQPETVLFPQNPQWTKTTEMVKEIAEVSGKTMVTTGLLAPFVVLAGMIPGKIGGMVDKAFGSMTYDFEMSDYDGIEYQIYDLKESIERTEGDREAEAASEKMNTEGTSDCETSVAEFKDTLVISQLENAPLVSIITVSYNSASTIRRTIESVLNQTYTNIEYRIVDGLSTDNTVEIAKEYESRFAERGIRYIITSEPDKGIYDAMNKGIRASKGVLVGMVNSDDAYEPIAVETAVKSYLETGYDYFYGDINLIKPDGTVIVKKAKKDTFPTSRHWNHPSNFVTKATYDELGLFRCEGIHDDFEFFLRVRKAQKNIVVVNKILSNFNVGGTSNDKTFAKCKKRCLDRYRSYRVNGYSPLYIIECIFIEFAKFILS